MNRQRYRFAIRELDKQLKKMGEYAQKLNVARAIAPTDALRVKAENSLMVLSQQVYELLNRRKSLVMAFIMPSLRFMQ